MGEHSNPHGKTALVTGAAGFIGSWIVEEFVARGWRVLALVHRKREARWQRFVNAGGVGRVIPVSSDITDAGRLRTDVAAACRALANQDGSPPSGREMVQFVIHAAGRASDVGHRGTFRRLNLEGTRNVGRLAVEREVSRLVFISTTDVYGIRDFEGEAEDALPLAMTVRNPYPEFKIQAEEWIRRNLPKSQYAILRPGAVWGPGDTTLTPRIIEFLRRTPAMVHFGPWRGRNRWPLAHVRNVALAAFLAASRPEAAGRAINVLDAEHTSLDDFYRHLAQLYLPNKKLRTVHLPRWLAKAMGLAVSMVSDALNLEEPFTDPSFYAAHHISSNLDFSNRRLREMIDLAGRSLVSLEEGLKELQAETPASRGTVE